MDSHLDARLSPPPSSEMASHPRAILPGEGSDPSDPATPGIAADRAGWPAGTPRGRPRRWGRTILLATAAVLAVTVAGGTFLLSPYNTVVPIDTARVEAQARQLAASAGITRPPLVAPASRLATAPRPDSTPVYRPDASRVGSDEQVREILGYHPGAKQQVLVPQAGASATPDRAGDSGRPEQRPAPDPASSLPAEPGSEVGAAPVSRPTAPATPPPSQRQADPAPSEPGMRTAARLPPPASNRPASEPTAFTAAANSPTTTVAPVPPPDTTVVDNARGPEQQATTFPRAAASTPADPAATAIELRPAPMSRGEQVDVLNVVAQLGVIVRDLRVENAALRARVQASVDKVDGAVADFSRRLALAEARGAINAAMGVEDPPAPAATLTFPGPAATVRTVSLSPAPAGARPHMAAVPAVNAAARRYKVTAASPGLAMLSELDRSGGEGSPLQVQVGDDVPGYGRITAIQQRGATWSVRTDRGAIE